MTIEISPMLKRLFACCKDKETGTFFIVSDDNSSGQVVIEKGILLRCSFKNQKGMEVLSTLKRMQTEKFKFTNKLLLPMSSEASIQYSEDALELLGYSAYLASLASNAKGIDSEPNKNPVQKTAFKKEKVGMYRGKPLYKEVEYIIESSDG